MKQMIVKLTVLLYCSFFAVYLSAQEPWDGTVATSYASGNGSQAFPYEIQTPGQFAYFMYTMYNGENYNGKYLILSRDIDINNNPLPNKATFAGLLDGNGHCICNVSSKNNSLFSTISGVVENVYFSLNGNLANNVSTTGIIYNCKVDVVYYFVGGDKELGVIARNNHGNIVKCHTRGNISCSNGGRYTFPGEAYSIVYLNYEGANIVACTTELSYSLFSYNAGTYSTSTIDLNAWIINHHEIQTASFDYIGQKCNVTINDPENVIETKSFIVNNGTQVNEINITDADCTIGGWKRFGTLLDGTTVINREFWNMSPVWMRSIQSQPTSSIPKFSVDDKEHAQYQWYKTAPSTLFYENWVSDNKDNSTTSSKTYDIEAEIGDVFTFDYVVSSEQYSDYFKVAIDGAVVINTSGIASSNYSYTFANSGMHNIVISYVKDYSGSANEDEAAISCVELLKEGCTNELLPNETTSTLSSTLLSSGDKYFCKVSYTNCSTKLTSNSIYKELSTDISTFDNVLYFNDTEHRAGDFALALNMKNSKENITAFQCDIYLPEGVEWKSTTDKRGNTVYTQPTFNEDRTDDSYHTIAPMAKNADGSYNIIVYSMDNANILETDGALLTLPLTISEDMEAGDYNLCIKNIVMTDVDANQVKVAEVVSKLTIPSYEIGDANGDDEINVTDIVQTISYIRGNNPTNFIIGAADVNEDGEINVTDIVNIIKIIRSAQAPASAKPRKAAIRKSASASNLEVIPFTVSEGSTSATAQLDMNNPGDEFTAFQCDVYFPEGIDWANTIDKRGNNKIINATFNAAAERTDASYHTVDVGLNANDSYNVMVYSMANEIFLEESGAILDMPFVFDADLEPGAYDVTLKHIVLTRPDGTDAKPDDYTFTILVGSPEIASATLHGDYTADAVSELNTALASNTTIAAIDFTEATSVDAATEIKTGNKNLLVYVNEGTSVKNSQNVVAGDECENLVLTDGYDFAAPKAFTATSASYSRTAPTTYGTIVLPFVPTTGYAEFYELTGVSTTSFEFQKATSPVAGTPYLYAATSDNLTAANVNIATAEAGKVSASGWTMQGTYGKEVFGSADNVYAVYEDKVYLNTGTLTMNPFRAYFTGSTSGVPMNISIDGATVIGSIENGELTIDAPAYNLAGQKVGKGYKGIVLTNGRKEIRK